MEVLYRIPGRPFDEHCIRAATNLLVYTLVRMEKVRVYSNILKT